MTRIHRVELASSDGYAVIPKGGKQPPNPPAPARVMSAAPDAPELDSSSSVSDVLAMDMDVSCQRDALDVGG